MSLRGSKECEKLMSHGISEKGRSSFPTGYQRREGAHVPRDSIKGEELISYGIGEREFWGLQRSVRSSCLMGYQRREGAHVPRGIREGEELILQGVAKKCLCTGDQHYIP